MNSTENRTTNYLSNGTPIEILKSISEGAVKTQKYEELQELYLAENISMKRMISSTMAVALPILGIILAVARSKLKGFMVALAAIIPAAVWLSYLNRENEYRSSFRKEEQVIVNILSQAIAYCSKVKELKIKKIKKVWSKSLTEKEAEEFLESKINEFDKGRFDLDLTSLYKEIPTVMPYINAIKEMQLPMDDLDSDVHQAWKNLRHQCTFQARMEKKNYGWGAEIIEF